MKRREFLAAGAAAAVTGALLQSETVQADDQASGRELIEVRILYTESEDAKKRLLERCDQILVPTHQKLGFRKTGVFSVNQELHEGDKNFDPIYSDAVFVVTSAKTFDQLEAFHELLHTTADADRRIQTFAEDALYTNFESSLLRAFPNCPTLEVPNLSPDRVVQFRRYFSPSCDRNRAKRAMFDTAGELEIFKSCEMLPVFFGEMLYGPFMPNISYMLSFKNNDERVANWKKFVESDAWKELRVKPEFKDTATKIRNLFLKPTPGSEI